MAKDDGTRGLCDYENRRVEFSPDRDSVEAPSREASRYWPWRWRSNYKVRIVVFLFFYLFSFFNLILAFSFFSFDSGVGF